MACWERLGPACHPAKRPKRVNKGSTSKGKSRYAVSPRASAGDMQKLEVAIQSINKVLSLGGNRATEVGRKHEKSKAMKIVKCSASVSCTKEFQEQQAYPLEQYLGLPPEEYSLLDPNFIRREEGSTNVFTLTVPMNELVGINLTPQLSVKVTSEPGTGEVKFEAQRFDIGSARLRALFALEFCASIRAAPTAPPPSQPFASLLSFLPGRARPPTPSAPSVPPSAPLLPLPAIDEPPLPGAMHTSTAPHTHDATQAPGALANQAPPAAAPPPGATLMQILPEGSAASAAPALSSPVAAAVSAEATVPLPPGRPVTFSLRLAFSLPVPGPLAALPGPLLSTTGSLVTRVIAGAMMPVFLDLLARDYGRWARDEPGRAAGDAVGTLLPGHPGATAGAVDAAAAAGAVDAAVASAQEVIAAEHAATVVSAEAPLAAVAAASGVDAAAASKQESNPVGDRSTAAAAAAAGTVHPAVASGQLLGTVDVTTAASAAAADAADAAAPAAAAAAGAVGGVQPAPGGKVAAAGAAAELKAGEHSVAGRTEGAVPEPLSSRAPEFQSP